MNNKQEYMRRVIEGSVIGATASTIAYGISYDIGLSKLPAANAAGVGIGIGIADKSGWGCVAGCLSGTVAGLLFTNVHPLASYAISGAVAGAVGSVVSYDMNRQHEQWINSLCAKRQRIISNTYYEQCFDDILSKENHTL